MARIPIPVYQQSRAPGGPAAMPTASGQRVESAGGAMRDAGHALSGAASTMLAVEDHRRREEEIRRKELERQDELDAGVWVSGAMSQARITWEQNLTERKAAAAPGARDFTPTVLEDFDKFAGEQMEQAPTPKSKAKLTESLNQLRVEVAAKAIGFQAKAHEDWRTDTVTQAINTSASLLLLDPSQYGAVAGEQRAIIENLDVNPQLRSKLLEQADRAFANAAVQGMVRANPQATYDALVGIERKAPEGARIEIKPGTATGPRGIRNNNPGNIVKSGAKWEGETDSADPRYTAFATPEHGLRALATNLLTYQDKHGLRTVEGIVSRWAPASENNTQAYVAAVAKAVGVKSDEQLDLRKPSTMRALMRAIVKHENGVDPYSDAQVSRGVNAALGGEKLEAPATLVTTPYLPEQATIEGAKAHPAIAALPFADRMQLIQQAQAAVQRGQADERSVLTRRVNDASAMALDGIRDPKPLTADDFIRAYGQRDGPAHYDNYARTQALASDVQAVTTMTPEQRLAMLERTTPVAIAGQPGYEQERQRYLTRVQAVERVRKEELDDPMRAAIGRGVGGAKPIDFASQDSMREELAARVGVAEVMTMQYRTPYALLTKAEARQLSAVLASAPTAGKVQTLMALRDAVREPVAYRAILQQIAPDSPVTAAAGVIADKQNPLVIERTFSADQVFKQSDVAGVILEGEAILNKSKGARAEDGKGRGFAMPPEKDLRSEFANYVGNAFAGDPNGEDIAYQAYRAYYAGQAAREGDITGELNGERAKNAARLVTGGVHDFNGNGRVLLPWGMNESQFRAQIEQEWQKLVAAGKAAGSIGAYGLQSSGDSRYLVRSGTGYLLGKDGKPVELDLTPPAWTRLKPPA